MRGTVLVNIADLMQRWTADKLKSVVGLTFFGDVVVHVCILLLVIAYPSQSKITDFSNKLFLKKLVSTTSLGKIKIWIIKHVVNLDITFTCINTFMIANGETTNHHFISFLGSSCSDTRNWNQALCSSPVISFLCWSRQWCTDHLYGWLKQVSTNQNWRLDKKETCCNLHVLIIGSNWILSQEDSLSKKNT